MNEISRREFVKALAVLSASIAAGELGDELSVPEKPELLTYDKEATERALRLLFDVQFAFADNQEGNVNHDITPIEQSGSSILLGEISSEELHAYKNYKEDVGVSGLQPTGAEVASRRSIEHSNKVLEQYPIILATDSHLISVSEVLNKLKVVIKETPDTLPRVIANLPALGMGLLGLRNSNTENANPEALKEKKTISRRHFNEIITKAMIGFSLGYWGRHLVNRIRGNELEKFTYYESAESDEVMKTLEDIYNPFDEYLITLRDCLIFLRTAHCSQLNFPSVIQAVHLTVASGHTDMFRYFTEKRSPEKLAKKYLKRIVDSTIDIINSNHDYFAPSEDPHYVNSNRISAASNLVRAYMLYGPTLIRINMDHTDTTLADLHEIEEKNATLSPFEMWCQIMKEYDDVIEDQSLKEILTISVGMYSVLLELNFQNSVDSEKIITWPGDPIKADTEYHFFGFKATFAQGFPVSFVESDAK